MPKIQLRVVNKGIKCLAPYDEEAEAVISKHAVNTILKADIRKPRSLKFHNKAHALADVVRKNVEGFETFTDANEVLKELQRIGNVKCISYRYFNGKTQEWETRRKEKSMKFSKMDNIEFQELYEGVCRTIQIYIWPGISQEEMDRMASFMPNE
jgi:hypothetical protein